MRVTFCTRIAGLAVQINYRKLKGMTLQAVVFKVSGKEDETVHSCFREVRRSRWAGGFTGFGAEIERSDSW